MLKNIILSRVLFSERVGHNEPDRSKIESRDKLRTKVEFESCRELIVGRLWNVRVDVWVFLYVLGMIRVSLGVRVRCEMIAFRLCRVLVRKLYRCSFCSLNSTFYISNSKLYIGMSGLSKISFISNSVFFFE